MHLKCLATMPMKYAVLAVLVPLVVGTTNKWKLSLHTSQAYEELGDLKARAENWNDEQANPIGVNEDLGWNYDFCRIEFPRTAVVNKKLYIDGGTLWLSPKGEGLKSVREINTRLLEIDISEPITQDNYKIRTISKPATVPNVGAGHVFMPPNLPSTNNTKFYTFGGYFPSFNKSLDTYVEPPKNPQGELFSYDTSSDKWENVSLANGSDQVIWPQEGSSVSIPELGLAFYLGFYQNSSTNSLLEKDEYRAFRGFLKVEWNIDDPSAPPRWTNDTNLPFDPTIGASLVHIPGVGEKGILVMFGGYTMLPGDNLPGAWNPMKTAYVYDISKGVWHQQATSTTAKAFPTSRGYSCIIMVPAKDSSSYNIYMYGGGGRGGGDGTDDMWVLSLPSFTWINLWVQGKFPSVGMSCTLLNDNQILHVGPRMQRTEEVEVPCRPLWSVFDIAQLKWVTEFNPQKKGTAPVHSIISKVIGGNSEGNATVIAPEGGWASDAMNELFSYSQESNTTDVNQDSGDDTEDNSDDDGGSKVNRAALIGGLVGGLVALLFLIGWLVQRKRETNGSGFGSRHKLRGSAQELEASLSTPSPYAQELGGYYGKPPTQEPPPSELIAQYPWAARERMVDGHDGDSRHELEGAGAQERKDRQQEQAVGLLRDGRDRTSTDTSIPTPAPYYTPSPPEISRQVRENIPRSAAFVSRKPVGGGAYVVGNALNRPSSRFSEDLS